MAWYNLGIRSVATRLKPNNLHAYYKMHYDKNVILLDWINKGDVRYNWGDAVAPVIVEWISGKHAINQRDVFVSNKKIVYTSIGSMLGTIDRERVSVWGTGFVSSDSEPQSGCYDIRAVRGPLTKQILDRNGINCPDVFGDPALLFPRIYKPDSTKEFLLGIIPHYKERNFDIFNHFAAKNKIKVIDICAGIRKVAEDVNKCEYIISGSLHGLVLADGYGIPTMWMQLSNRPYGSGFKFRDYMASVNRPNPSPISIDKGDEAYHIISRFDEYELYIDLDKFYKSCPFLNEYGVDDRAELVLDKYDTW